MKWRYLKVAGDWIYGKNNISKDDLVAVAKGNIDTIIDLEEMKIFDAESNSWKQIEGDHET